MSAVTSLFFLREAFLYFSKRFKKYLKRKTRTLRDYPPIYDDVCGHIDAEMDGLLDYKFVWATYRRSWEQQLFGEKTLVNQLSEQLEQEIKNRYFQKGMANAYQRAGRLVFGHKRLAPYYNFDSETTKMCEKAAEISPFKCFECCDRGKVWGYMRGITTTVPCECREKSWKVS